MKENHETDAQYHNFLESLVIEELIKDFNFNCPLKLVEKKRFSGGIITYYFEDINGIIWERDINSRLFQELALRNPKIRERK